MRDTNLVSGAPLYAHPGHVEKQLAALGRDRGGPLTPERLFPFDHLHNRRIEAVHRAADTLGLGPASKVLEIGSGFGGQARYLADRTACHVTALELQETMHQTARCLTKRCGLAERITHLCGDALIHPLPCDSFDAVVSLCAILHIADRPRLCTRLACALHAGGKCYIEDCYLRAPLRGRALREMQRYISGPSLSSIADYVRDLREAGFVDIAVTDLSEDWAAFAAGRLSAYEANEARYVRVLEQPAYDAIHALYAATVRFYRTGNLGGVRLLARRPQVLDGTCDTRVDTARASRRSPAHCWRM